MKEIEYEDILLFHFGLPHDRDASEDWSRAFYRILGLPINSGCWAELSLDSKTFDVFLDEVRQRKKRELANFIGYAYLRRQIRDSSRDLIEWYEILPSESIWDFIKQDQIDGITVEAIDAYKLPTTLNVGTGALQNVYVSERFKKAVESLSGTGVDFVWLRDTGKYQSSQWYLPIATLPMGKGMDDPWFDKSKRKGSDSWQPKIEPFVTGTYHFDVNQIRRGAKFLTDRHRQLFAEFKGCNLTIVTPKKYSSHLAPNSDFAFNWKLEDQSREGRPIRQRGLCIRRGMKEKLVELSILREVECVPVEVHYEWTHGPILDKKPAYPVPLKTPSEIQVLASRLDPIRTSLERSSRPTHEITFAKSIQLLKKEKKNRPGDFRSAARGDLGDIPQPCAELLKVTDGGTLNSEVELISRADLRTENTETRAILKDLFERPEKYFQFAHCSNGDWISICIDEGSEKHLSVSRFDHETSSIGYTWKHMGLFLADMILGFYERISS